MPLGYECRAKLIKQNPAIPTVRRGPISIETGTPGPDHYDTPQICGKSIRYSNGTFCNIIPNNLVVAEVNN